MPPCADRRLDLVRAELRARGHHRDFDFGFQQPVCIVPSRAVQRIVSRSADVRSRGTILREQRFHFPPQFVIRIASLGKECAAGSRLLLQRLVIYALDLLASDRGS